jgi:hypothetical protein
MKITLIPRYGALEARLREIGERLLRQSGRIARCRLTLESDGAASGCWLKIHLSMPGAEIHVGSTFRPDDGAEFNEALKEAYQSARRQLLEVERSRYSGATLRVSRTQ